MGSACCKGSAVSEHALEHSKTRGESTPFGKQQSKTDWSKKSAHAIAAARAELLANGQNVCTLTPQLNARLLEIFGEFLQTYKGKEVEEVYARLAERLEPEGLKQLRAAYLHTIFDDNDLHLVAAYVDFAAVVLRIFSSLRVEVRVEGWHVYLLVPPEATVLRNLEQQSLMWVHDESWATARFRAGGKDLGLCGQQMGISKFCTPCNDIPESKGAVLDALGLRGYPAFDKPGPLFVVRARGSSQIMALAQPLVPLLYKVGSSPDKNASKPSSWATAANFQQGVMPGFTSGLRAELVMRTFQLPASLPDIEALGVTCLEIGDHSVGEVQGGEDQQQPGG